MKNIVRVSAMAHKSFNDKVRRNISLSVRLTSLSLASRSHKIRRSVIVEKNEMREATTRNYEHKMNNGKAMFSWNRTTTKIVINRWVG